MAIKGTATANTSETAVAVSVAARSRALRPGLGRKLVNTTVKAARPAQAIMRCWAACEPHVPMAIRLKNRAPMIAPTVLAA